MKPDLLSFHIASKIPISDTARQELLEIDGTTYRLRKEIELLESFDKIRCKTCQVMLGGYMLVVVFVFVNVRFCLYDDNILCTSCSS